MRWSLKKWLFGKKKKSPANSRSKSKRRAVKPNGRWEPAVVKDVGADGTIILRRDTGRIRDLPLRPDTFKRLQLMPMKKGDRFQIRLGNTHLGPEVARVRPIK